MNINALIEEIRSKADLSSTDKIMVTSMNGYSQFLVTEQLPLKFNYPKKHADICIDHTGILFKDIFSPWENIELTCIRTIDTGRFDFYSFIFITDEKKVFEIKFNYAFIGVEPSDFGNIVELYKKKWEFLKQNPPKPFPYSIRKANTNDIDHITKLFKETIQTVCTKDYSPEQIALWSSSAQNKELWNKRMAEQHFLVCTNEKEITGFASIDPRGYIDLLYVHKNHQRKGIAERLLSELEHYAKTNGLVEVWADVSLTARPFFASKGFTIKREYLKFVQGMEFKNAIMVKSLKKN